MGEWERSAGFEDAATDRAAEVAAEGDIDSVEEAFLSGALWAALVAEGRIDV